MTEPMTLDSLLLVGLEETKIDAHEKHVADLLMIDVDRLKAACLKLARAELLVDAGHEEDLGTAWEPHPKDIDGLREKARAAGLDLSQRV